MYNLSKLKKIIIFFVLSFGSGTFYLTPFFLNQYINQISVITGESLVNLQLLMTIYGITSLVFYIPGGWIADRLSPRLLFSTSMLFGSLLTFWYSLVGFNGYVDYTQLILIYTLYAAVNSLLFWSAFVKVIGMLGDKNIQVKLYARCEMWRGIFNVIAGFISIGLIGIIIVNSIFNPNNGSGIFFVLFFYSCIYLIVSIVTAIIIPGPWIQRYTKRNLDGLFEYKPMASTEPIIVTSEQELKKVKVEYRNKFWKQVWTDFLFAIKNVDVWLISFLIFFVMNSYNIVTAFGTIFTINYGINENDSSFLNYLYNYATPILGAIIFAMVTTKKTKSSSKTTIYINIFLLITSILMLITSTIELENKLILGILGTIWLSLIMLFIGASRAIYWSILSEINIPLGTVGIVVGLISILGFSGDIWINPLTAIMMEPHKINTGAENLYSKQAFINIYIFNLVNAFLALIISYAIYQRKIVGKFFTKNQIIMHFIK